MKVDGPSSARHGRDEMAFSTIDDVAREVSQRFGCDASEVSDACRDAIQGRYEDVEITEDFLRAVWSSAFPDVRYPF